MANEIRIPAQSTLLLDRYQIEALLGEGGLGTVVRAFDTRLKRIVAVKTLKRSLAPVESDLYRTIEERFIREAEAGSRLGSHPNVVVVYDFVSGPDQTYYLILEYAPGGTVADRLKHGSLPLPASLRLATDVAHGLQVTHDAGIVHRDIKPANIFLTADGRAQVGDFGIAQMDNVSARTRTTVGHPGTPLYMSPEQAGTTGYLRPESDQYSVGLVLFEMITGKAYKRLRQRDAERLLSALPAQLVAVIERMLEQHPDDRYATMHEVGEELQEIRRLLGAPPVLMGQDIVERPPDAMEQEPVPQDTPALPSTLRDQRARDTPKLERATDQISPDTERRVAQTDRAPSTNPREEEVAASVEVVSEAVPAEPVITEIANDPEPMPEALAPSAVSAIAEADNEIAPPVIADFIAADDPIPDRLDGGREIVAAADITPPAIEQPIVITSSGPEPTAASRPRHIVRNAVIALTAVMALGILGMVAIARAGGIGGGTVATATVQAAAGGGTTTAVSVSPSATSGVRTAATIAGSPVSVGPLVGSLVASAAPSPTVAPTATATVVLPTATPKPSLGVFGVGATRRNDLETLTPADAADTFITGEDVFAFVNYDGAQPGVDAFEVTVVTDGTPRAFPPVVVRKPGGFVFVPLGSFPPAKMRLEVRHNGALVGAQPEITIAPAPTATPIPPTPTPVPPAPVVPVATRAPQPVQQPQVQPTSIPVVQPTPVPVRSQPAAPTRLPLVG